MNNAFFWYIDTHRTNIVCTIDFYFPQELPVPPQSEAIYWVSTDGAADPATEQFAGYARENQSYTGWEGYGGWPVGQYSVTSPNGRISLELSDGGTAATTATPDLLASMARISC